MTRDPPTWPGLPIVGSLLDFRGDRATLLRRAAEAYGPVVVFRVGPRRITLVADPALIDEVLTRRHAHYLKQTRAYRMMRDGLGQGLLTSDGEAWARQRRLASPAFRRDRLDGFADLIEGSARALAADWAARGDGAVVDVVPAFHRLAMRIAGRAFLGQEIGPLADTIRTSFNAAITLTTRRVLSPFSTPISVPTPTNLRLRRHLAVLDRAIGGLIAARRASGEVCDDFLGRLIAARDPETGASMDDAQLLDEVKTLFIAGFETVSNALAWSVYELGRNPAWQDRLRDEARAVLDGATAPAEGFRRLEVARRVFAESLRRYSPIWAVGRTPIEDETIGDYRVPAGSWVFPSPYVVHHLPEHWPDPDRWDPDRFVPEAAAGRHKNAFIPYLVGPRRCIGEHFAQLEGVLILATLAARVGWRTVEAVDPEPVVTLRPARPIRVRLHAG
jgi:cytochrome P450